MARHFQKHGHDVLLIVRRRGAERPAPEGLRVIYLLTDRFPMLDKLMILFVLLRFRPAAVHACEAGLSFVLLTKLFPVIVRAVGNDFLRPWFGFNLPLRFLLYRVPSVRFRKWVEQMEIGARKRVVVSGLRRADRIVTNSEWTAAKIREEGVRPEAIDVLSGGVDTSFFVPPVDATVVRGNLGIELDRLVLLTVAHLNERKGVDAVLRAVDRLRHVYPRILYVVVGEGPDRPRLQALISDLCLQKHTLLAGRQSQEEVLAWCQACDVYVQLSRNVVLDTGFTDNAETMGRTFIEASACGKPVVASNVGGIPSVVKDGTTGLLVSDPLDVDEAVSTISTLLEAADLRKRLGKNGHDLCVTEFSWETIGTRVEAALTECATDRSGG